MENGQNIRVDEEPDYSKQDFTVWKELVHELYLIIKDGLRILKAPKPTAV